ncbi:MAG TPA: PEGA domain-containing protein [Vicinamibacterales bacterium]|nr:PEGA domain-containing protein [Vicinamibacterales bacterium]
MPIRAGPIGLLNADAPRVARAPVPPTATAPRYVGTLAIESDPTGARVSVNGRFVGVTPVVLRGLPAGSCVVRVESDGYELWSTAARVVANRRTRLAAILQPGSERQH